MARDAAHRHHTSHLDLGPAHHARGGLRVLRSALGLGHGAAPVSALASAACRRGGCDARGPVLLAAGRFLDSDAALAADAAGPDGRIAAFAADGPEPAAGAGV